MDQRMRRSSNVKTINGNVVWSKPVSLSRAAKIMSRFAAVETGASSTVSMYVDRTTDALNRLVQLHKKTAREKRKRDGDHIDSENSVVNNKITTITTVGDEYEDEAKDLEKKKKGRDNEPHEDEKKTTT